jgi:hypothetical protein
MNNFSKIPNEIILNISSKCSYNDIHTLSITCKRFNKLRLYRLYLSYLVTLRFIGSITYKDLKTEFIEYFKPIDNKYKYNINDYLKDLNYFLFLDDDLFKPIFIHANIYKYKYSCSRTLLNIIKYNHRLQVEKSNTDKLKIYNRCHSVYRVNCIVYNHLRRNHFNILAIIY